MLRVKWERGVFSLPSSVGKNINVSLLAFKIIFSVVAATNGWFRSEEQSETEVVGQVKHQVER